MSSIDDRIVNMQFNNAEFERNIHTTMGSLDSLNQKMNLTNAGRGFDQIAAGVENISSKFGALGAIGFTALQNLTNSAWNFAKKISGSLLDPIVEGGKKRALNIEQAKFALEGLNVSWNKIKDDILYGVKDTAYGLDEAAKAASSLAASQVHVGAEMKQALRGISGVAAMTSSSYSDIADVFTKVAGQGRLMGDDLLRLSSRGLNAAAILAKSMGTTEAKVRQMVTAGKINFKEFAKAMDDAFGQHAKDANKTYEGALSNMHAALARLGADMAAPEFDRLRNVFNALTPKIDDVHAALMPLINIINKQMDNSSKVIVKFINSFDTDKVKVFTGYMAHVGDTISVAFKIVNSILKTVGQAFGDVFPDNTIFTIREIIGNFDKLVDSFKMGEVELWMLRRTFAGVFAIFDIAGTIIGKFIGMIANLLGYVTDGNNNFLQFTGNLGDWLVSVDNAIKKGEGLNTFFDTLTSIIKKPIDFIKSLGTVFNATFEKIAAIDFVGIGDRVKHFFDPFSNLATLALAGWQKFTSGMVTGAQVVSPIVNAISQLVGKLGDAVHNMVSNLSINDLGNVAKTGGLVVFGNLIARFINTLIVSFKSTVGMGTTIKGFFTTLTNQLKVMQASLQADVLLKQASAIGILAGSAVLLASVDSNKLATALLAMSGMMKGLLVAMAQFDQMSGIKGIFKINAVADALTTMATAVLILSFAVKIMGGLSWDELAKGLIGMSVGLGLLVAGVRLLPKDMAVRTAGLMGMAGAINLLALAFKVFSSMSWEELGKGMTGMAAALLGIAGAIRLMPKDLAARSAGLFGIGIALNAVASAMSIVAQLSWEGILKGLLGLGGALVIIAGAMNVMPKDMILKAAALVAIGIALNIIAGALAIMGAQSWESVAKGLITLAGAMLIIAVATAAMTEALPGAAALLVVSAALAILAPVLLAFGAMSLQDIGNSILMLAATFLILGLAGVALTPAIPTLLGLGVAIALIGAGVALAGIGILAFATGLTALSAASALGTAALVTMVAALIGLIPMIAQQIGLGLIAILNVISQSGSTFIAAGVTLLSSLLTAINIIAPQAIDTLMNLVSKLVTALADNVPKFVDSGMRMLNGILTGIRDHIRETTKLAIQIVTGFVNGIADGLPSVVDSAANLVIQFVNSVADTISNRSEEMGKAGGHLASALVEGMVKGTLAGISSVVEAAKRIAQAVIDQIKKTLGIASPSKVLQELGDYAMKGFYYGILGMQEPVLDAVTQTVNEMNDKLKTAITDANNDIKTLSDKLRKQEKDKNKSKKDKAAIKKTKEELANAKLTRDNATAAQNELNKALAANQQTLKDLSNQYAANDIQLQQYQKNVDDLTNSYNSLHDSVKNQFSATQDFSSEGDIVNDYITSLQQQIDATIKFNDDLAKLRAEGLDDTLYQKLLAKGLSAQPFITALLESGQIGVDTLKNLDKQLDDVAGNLATNAADSMYKAGLDTAQGLLDGLKAKQDAIAAQMVSIADAMVEAIRKKLDMHSPSRVFSGLGGYTVNGYINGIQKMLPEVSKVSKKIGTTTFNSVNKTLPNLSDLLTNGLDTDLSPVIRPVMDLSLVEKSSDQINKLLQAKPITVNTSYDRAAILSRDTANNQNGTTDQSSATDEAAIVFNQYNNSPKALSYGEIYRQTRNGLSVVRKVVTPA